MANNSWIPVVDMPTAPVLGLPANPAPPPMPAPWQQPTTPAPTVWDAEREALLIAARKELKEIEELKRRATDQVAAALSPYLGAGFNVALLVANAKRVRAALAPFDHDV